MRVDIRGRISLRQRVRSVSAEHDAQWGSVLDPGKLAEPRRRLLRLELEELEMPRRVASRLRFISPLAIAVGLGAASCVISAARSEGNYESTSASRASPMTLRQTLDLSTRGAAVAVAWSADGSMLTTASNYGSELYIWRSDGEVLQRIPRAGDGPVLGSSIAFTARDQGIVFAPRASDGNDAAATVWDVKSGHVSAVIPGPQLGDDYPLNRLQHFELTPNKSLLVGATAGQSAVKAFKRNVAFYDTTSWTLLRAATFPEGISSLCMFGDGRLVAVGSLMSGAIRVFDTESAAEVTRFDTIGSSPHGVYSLSALAGSPKGDLLFVGVGTIVTKGDGRPSREQNAWVEQLGSTNAVRMVHLPDGKTFATYGKARAPIRDATWDPRGRFVAFIDNTARLFIWNAAKPNEVTVIDLPTRAMAISIASAGDRLAVATDTGVRIYTVAN
jgi:WD40 repeat protein